ncbi:hypothetical protein QBC34DRAFT_99142 [Podospora aff. communis PSN243]|uniref:Uncharacterized protein n=1 Tax=Podospora aff. communis PSN243 TaxID=3040156 RepID=A0AAV9GME4_9PEZI|nr:hypothetical protein QBC34DRAFT_99142 [Podospora aff. communis PSN243]
MLRRESYGFATFKTNEGTITYYLATISAFIIWSHISSTSQTQGIIIPRISDSVNDRDGIFETYAQTISTHLELVRYPWFLRYVAIVEGAHWIDRIYETALHILREAERNTGYGCWESWKRSDSGAQGRDVKDFDKMSKHVGFSAAALANVVRHIKIVTDLIGIPLTDTKQGDERIAEVMSALVFIREQLAARRTDTDYLQERARTQLQVVFNLINQSEAAASRQIAAATKKDSASMKVLAVMTLVFLPGTYFATLLSIPSLYWIGNDEPGSPQFWVYWAFSVPCTLALLVLYGFYSGRFEDRPSAAEIMDRITTVDLRAKLSAMIEKVVEMLDFREKVSEMR